MFGRVLQVVRFTGGPMARAKRKREDPAFTYRPNRKETEASNTYISISADNRRVNTQRAKVTTQPTAPASYEEVATDVAAPDAPEAELDLPPEDIPPTFYHEIAGVQVLTKAKSKRYESSVRIPTFL